MQLIINTGPFRVSLIITRNFPPFNPIGNGKMAGTGFIDVQRIELMQIIRDIFGD